MNIWDFASEHYITFLFIVWSAAATIKFVIALPFRCINLYNNGWPPEHCDADGESVENEDGKKVINR